MLPSPLFHQNDHAKADFHHREPFTTISAFNIHYQALGAQEVLKNSCVDTRRVAVWGGGGGGTPSLLQYPDICKTGISIAAVDNQQTGPTSRLEAGPVFI